jgi:hypothetical protein
MAGAHESVELEIWQGPWPADDPDANFKADVAAYCLEDPLPGLRRLSESTGIPLGALVRYVLARWSGAGSETLLAVGPSMIERMWQVVADAEADSTDAARLDAYGALREMITWLRIPTTT